MIFLEISWKLDGMKSSKNRYIKISSETILYSQRGEDAMGPHKVTGQKSAFWVQQSEIKKHREQ